MAIDIKQLIWKEYKLALLIQNWIVRKGKRKQFLETVSSECGNEFLQKSKDHLCRLKNGKGI